MPNQDLPDFARAGQNPPLSAPTGAAADAEGAAGQAYSAPAPRFDPQVGEPIIGGAAPVFGPPAPGAQPLGAEAFGSFAPAAGATAVRSPRRRHLSSALVGGGVGMLTALAVLAGAGGGTVLFPASQPTVTVTAPANAGQSGSGATRPTLPSDPGQFDPSGTSGQGSTGQGSTGTTTGKAATNATDAQSRGVVLITTTMSGGSGAGTGMVIGSDGLILTNYHVVQGSTDVEVEIASTGKSYTAKVLGHSATADVALLKIDATGLQTVTLDTDAVNVGDAVTAVGNAQGQDYLTAAAGTITDTSDTVSVSNDSAAGTETLTGVYVSDAAAQPGDSGGPLFDAQNEVTGMTTAGQQAYSGARTRSATTVATYAVPIAKAMEVVKTIEAGTETATVRIGANPYLGIMVTGAGTGSGSGSATDVTGVGVSEVTSGTPAAKAGITAGSTITSVAGTKVSSQAELAAVLAEHNPGDGVRVAWTDESGKAHTAEVVLADSPVN